MGVAHEKQHPRWHDVLFASAHAAGAPVHNRFRKQWLDQDEVPICGHRNERTKGQTFRRIWTVQQCAHVVLVLPKKRASISLIHCAGNMSMFAPVCTDANFQTAMGGIASSRLDRLNQVGYAMSSNRVFVNERFKVPKTRVVLLLLFVLISSILLLMKCKDHNIVCQSLRYGPNVRILCFCNHIKHTKCYDLYIWSISQGLGQNVNILVFSDEGVQ